MMKEGIFTVWGYERGKGRGFVEIVLGADMKRARIPGLKSIIFIGA